MPFTFRPEESAQDRDKRLADLSDAFVLWASEAELIDIHVDDDGEMYFTKAACDCEFDDDLAFEDEESFDPAEALSIARPLPHSGRHRPAHRVHRLPLAAVPLAAGVLAASTAAYATTMSHNDAPVAEVTATPAPKPKAIKIAPVHRVTAPTRLVATPDPVATSIPKHTGDAFAIAIDETPKTEMLWVSAANSTMKPVVPVWRGKGKAERPLEIPGRQIVQIVEKVPTVSSKAAKGVVKVVVKIHPPKVKKPNPPKGKPVLPPVTLPPVLSVPPPVIPPVDTPPVETPPVVPPVDAVVAPVLAS